VCFAEIPAARTAAGKALFLDDNIKPPDTKVLGPLSAKQGQA